MSDTNPTPLTSQDAVRLARFALPGQGWRAYWPGNERLLAFRPDDPEDAYFNLKSLDDLALAEQRVVAAGLGDEYSDLLNPLIGGYDSCDASRHCFTTATAEQRARALLALLDAHPELEKP